ncbi:MAG: NAD(P)-dependent oxidoreductase [Candidatus Obscuribacterales bacterium]|nr:NAD(P)-dependent oxidoreductase [Candidatus Obscuribacterales bacterium]
MTSVAYLGLGIMGGAMAANLATKGHSVFGWNRTPGRPGARVASEAGANIIGSASDAVSQADVVFLCLSDVSDIEEMLLGANAVTKAAKKGTLFIDMSTTGPQCAQHLAQELDKLGMRFLDAPVSGGDIGAQNGTLTIMVGGAESDFEKAKPLFACIGKSITYCGPTGSGQAVKLCNQILCAVNMVAVTEAIRFAELTGIDSQLVIDVCSTGAGGSWALSNLGPKILKGDFAPGFKITDMRKDLRLVGQSLSDANHGLTGTTLAAENFQQTAALESGDTQGTQAMIRIYR